ncbi:MAG: hypothetical protein ACOCR0_02795 [Haloferacaceae archaeon]
MSAVPTASQGAVVVWLVGWSLLSVLCARVTILSLRTRSRVARGQGDFWTYFAYVGVAGVLCGGVGLIALVVGSTPAIEGALRGLLLTFTFLGALLVREAYYNRTLSNAERDRIGRYPARRAIEVGVIGAIALVGLGPFVTAVPLPDVVTAIAGGTVVVYGTYFQRKRARSPATRGTLIDTLLRQFVPVLAFAGGALVTPVFRPMLGAVVTETLVGVFLVMTGTSLIIVTIKLHQHLLSQR